MEYRHGKPSSGDDWSSACCFQILIQNCTYQSLNPNPKFIFNFYLSCDLPLPKMPMKLLFLNSLDYNLLICFYMLHFCFVFAFCLVCVYGCVREILAWSTTKQQDCEFDDWVITCTHYTCNMISDTVMVSDETMVLSLLWGILIRRTQFLYVLLAQHRNLKDQEFVGYIT